MFRKIITTVVVLLAILFWYMTLTVPMISATAPGLIALALSVLAYFIWPKKQTA
jgi:hypothetical protein